MVFYLIGIGMDINSISCDAKNILKKCDSVYLESYTVDFPYTFDDLSENLGVKLTVLQRAFVEDEHLLQEAKTKDIALLVYGDSLSATTHTQLILACKKQNIPYKIFHNSSIFITIAETGLQLYKFGKTASMPQWTKAFEPTSFLDYYLENKNCGAHTLLLTDIGLDICDAIDQLEIACNKKECKIDKIIILSNAGLDSQKIYYDTLPNLKIKEISKPYCIIIPGNLHFLEEEYLNVIKEN